MLTLLISVPINLCVTTVTPSAIEPLSISLDILHPIPFWMHLSVSALDCETESSKDYFRFLNFLSTNAVLLWSVCLESLFCKMTSVFLKLVFVVVVGT